MQRSQPRRKDPDNTPLWVPSASAALASTYLEYIIQETYRLYPLSPLGIPHALVRDDATQDDEVYNDRYRIPPGTIVYPNVWAMGRDKTVYSDPDEFMPERYMPVPRKPSGDKHEGRGEPYPQGNFGFGRRVCIGKPLAGQGVRLAVGMIVGFMHIQWPGGEPPRSEADPGGIDQQAAEGPGEGDTRDGIKWSLRGQIAVEEFAIEIVPREGMREALGEELRKLDSKRRARGGT